MNYSSNSQRAYEDASLAAHYAEQEVSDDQQEAYEAFRDARSDADTLTAINDWLDLSYRVTGAFRDYREAFESYDFGVWMASGGWERHNNAPDDYCADWGLQA